MTIGWLSSLLELSSSARNRSKRKVQFGNCRRSAALSTAAEQNSDRRRPLRRRRHYHCCSPPNVRQNAAAAGCGIFHRRIRHREAVDEQVEAGGGKGALDSPGHHLAGRRVSNRDQDQMSRRRVSKQDPTMQARQETEVVAFGGTLTARGKKKNYFKRKKT